MKLVLATHVYPLNPRAPTDIPGNFLPPFVYELCRRGAQVNVLAPNRPGDKVADADAPVDWYAWRGGERALGQLRPFNPRDALELVSLYRAGTAELANLARRQRADAVLACWAVPAGALAASACRALGLPYAVWSLGSDIHTSPRNPVLRPLVLRALHGAALRYANSESLRRAVEQLSGLDCDFLATGRRLGAAPPAEIPHDRVNFLFAGRLEPVKGVDLLLEALRRACEDGLDAHLYLAGDGSQRAALEAQARRLGLDARVTFLGFLTETPLVSFLRAVDAVVIPSRAEALPTIFTEAARAGTPAVTTDVGDLGALARQHGTAIVVEPENVDALARGLLAMARADRAALRRGMPALVAKFDSGAAAEKLLSDLERVLARGGAAANTARHT